MAQTVANGGAALEPRIIDSIYKGQELLWKDERPPRVLRRAVKPETAAELTRMMRQTVENGSAFKSFHDERGTPYLPGIQVAGKTGTLTRYKDNRFYTWFVGFAPADKPEVAIAALTGDAHERVAESADLLYHLCVLWVASGVDPADVYEELKAREGRSGLDDKAARKGIVR